MLLSARISFKRILCPVDLSPESSQALRYAIALTRAYRGRLFVLHCLDNEADRAHIQQVIARLVHEHLAPPALPPLSWEQVVIGGEPDIETPRQAAELRVDLIVMRSRRRPYAAALLGSITESVCRTAPCPILVTHASEREWVGKTTNEVGLQRVLVAYDFSSDAELALSYGVSLAQEYRSELHLLHVLPSRPKQTSPEIAMLPLTSESTFHKAACALKNAAPAEAASRLQIKYAVREGYPYREVLAYADDQEVELICMGASGTGFGMRALFGSNVDRVLRQAPCPVLIARPLKPLIADPAIRQVGAGPGWVPRHSAKERG